MSNAPSSANAQPNPTARGFSLAHLMGLLVFALCLVNHKAFLGGDSDLATHISYGREILRLGWIPSSDPLLYTVSPDVPLMLPEWGFEVFVALLDRAFGLTGPLILGALCASGLVFWISLWFVRQGVTAWPALLYSLVLFPGLGSHLLVRPHLCSWLLVLPVWRLIERRLTRPLRKGSLLTLGAAMALWANLHPGFVLFLPLLAIAVAGRALEARQLSASLGVRALAVGGVGFAASLATPYHIHLWTHVVRFLLHPHLNVARDFAPPDTVTGTIHSFTVVALAVWLPILARPRRVRATHFLLFIFMTAMAARSMRHIPLMTILLVPEAGLYLNRLLASTQWAEAINRSSERLSSLIRRPSSGANVVVAGLAVAMGFAVTTSLTIGFASRWVPASAIAWLEEHPDLRAERGYAGYVYSGLLRYHFPSMPVFIHSLNAVYPSELTEQFMDVDTAGPRWRQTLARHHVSWILVERHQHLSTVLHADQCWELAHRDRLSALYTRVREECAPPKNGFGGKEARATSPTG